MRMAGLLEVCADSVGSAVNAARGGADRIELCSALPLGGLSPDEDLFCMVRERVDIPVRVLLRPRAGDFLYDEDEFELLCRQASRFAGLGADGIVIGMLNPDGTLDAERMSALMACGDGCGVTLHRAFDVCRDAHEALRTAKKLGVDTILTSGQQARCADGAPLLRELVSESGERAAHPDRRRRERGRDPRARTADRCRRFSSVGEGSRAERHGVPSRKRPDGYSRTE